MLCRTCKREGLACVCRKDHNLSDDAKAIRAEITTLIEKHGRRRGVPIRFDNLKWDKERLTRGLEELEAKGWINVGKWKATT